MFSCSLLVYIYETENQVIKDVLNCTLLLKDSDNQLKTAEYFEFPPKPSFSKKGYQVES